jgi:hypothetical protein
MTIKEMFRQHATNQKLEKAKINYYLAGSKIFYGRKSDSAWREFKKAESDYKKAVRKFGSLGEANIELF